MAEQDKINAAFAVALGINENPHLDDKAPNFKFKVGQKLVNIHLAVEGRTMYYKGFQCEVKMTFTNACCLEPAYLVQNFDHTRTDNAGDLRIIDLNVLESTYMPLEDYIAQSKQNSEQ